MRGRFTPLCVDTGSYIPPSVAAAVRGFAGLVGMRGAEQQLCVIGLNWLNGIWILNSSHHLLL